MHAIRCGFSVLLFKFMGYSVLTFFFFFYNIWTFILAIFFIYFFINVWTFINAVASLFDSNVCFVGIGVNDKVKKTLQ